MTTIEIDEIIDQHKNDSKTSVKADPRTAFFFAMCFEGYNQLALKAAQADPTDLVTIFNDIADPDVAGEVAKCVSKASREMAKKFRSPMSADWPTVSMVQGGGRAYFDYGV